MRKTVYRMATALILACLLLQPMAAAASQTQQETRLCSLQLEYSKEGNVLADQEIRIHRVADIAPDGTITLAAPYDAFPVRLQGIASQKEWQDAANTLAAYITAEGLSPTQTAKTDASGKVGFARLEGGVYLVMAVTAETGGGIYRFENFCLFLPRPQEDGSLIYDLEAKPKGTFTPKPEEPEYTAYKVVKLWKDSGYRNKRPAAITVDLRKNGTHHETVTLNAANNWTYEWTALAGEDRWSVVEKDVPGEYTVVITESGTTFTITNTHPGPGDGPPKTGDTFAFGPWVTVMCVSGILLILLGIWYKRKQK